MKVLKKRRKEDCERKFVKIEECGRRGEGGK